jgi:hypothetical protein
LPTIGSLGGEKLDVTTGFNNHDRHVFFFRTAVPAPVLLLPIITSHAPLILGTIQQLSGLMSVYDFILFIMWGMQRQNK